jgi:hypothetical protein
MFGFGLWGRSGVGFRGDLKLIRHKRGPGFWWQFKNRIRPSFWLGWLAVHLAWLLSKTTGIVTLVSELRLIKRMVDGTIIDYGVVSYKMITTAGVNMLANDFNGGSSGADISNFKYHGWGGVNGTTPPATAQVAELRTDNALATPLVTTYQFSATLIPAVVAGTSTSTTFVDPTYTAQYMNTFTNPQIINEHVLANQPVIAGATVWDRSVYANTPMAANESMTFQYVLTIQSGG